MPAPNQEIELKLWAEPPALQRLRDHPRLKGRPGRRKVLQSVYFDTADLHLRDRGATLRLRAFEGKPRRVQTVKSKGGGDGLLARGEWECEISGDVPDADALGRTPVAALLRRAGGVAALKPVFSTQVERTVHDLRLDDLRIELALDDGAVDDGLTRETFCEVELEAKAGPPAGLYAVARDLIAAEPLRLSVLSKSDRGFGLAYGLGRQPVKAAAPPLDAGMTSAEGFQAIARSCLVHCLRNEPLFLGTQDPEALHQMRVAIRRLRSALSIFKTVVADDQLEAIKAELKWAGGALGEARDLDVFRHEVLARVENTAPDTPGLEALADWVERQRARAFRDALTAVRSKRFRLALIDTAAWIADGPWLRADDDLAAARRRRPLAAFAADELARRHGKIRKAAKKLAKLSPRKRHRQRIRIKKLRYGLEFMGPLFGGDKGKAPKDARRMIKSLKVLQDCLGDLNDIAEGRDLMVEAAEATDGADEGAARQGRRAFAAGAVAARQSAPKKKRLKAAVKEAKRLRTLDVPWG